MRPITINPPKNCIILGWGKSFKVNTPFTGHLAYHGEAWGPKKEGITGSCSDILYAAPIESDVAILNGHRQDPDHGKFRGILQDHDVDARKNINPEYKDAPYFEIYEEIQPVMFCYENNLPYIESAVVKYCSRHKFKGGAQDIRKAIHYLELLLELEYPKQ